MTVGRSIGTGDEFLDKSYAYGRAGMASARGAEVNFELRSGVNSGGNMGEHVCDEYEYDL